MKFAFGDASIVKRESSDTLSKLELVSSDLDTPIINIDQANNIEHNVGTNVLVLPFLIPQISVVCII
ncbi:MAG: hypothetical protein ACW97Z_15465 [Candidatus Hodarchaeales archaeon]